MGLHNKTNKNNVTAAKQTAFRFAATLRREAEKCDNYSTVVLPRAATRCARTRSHSLTLSGTCSRLPELLCIP